MVLDKAAVAHIATLARIRLAEAELESLAGELSHILDWVEQLNEVDTTGVRPMASVAAASLPMREDELPMRVDRRRDLATHAFDIGLSAHRAPAEYLRAPVSAS